MAIVFAKIVVAYLLGSLSGSLLLGRLRGLDIRRHGSGNAGGTNALRVAGWRFALAVVLIDVGKGALAAWIGADPQLSRHPGPSPDVVGAACAFAAVVGHCWPVFFGFRGGKGAGTALGGVLVLAPLLAAPMVGVWFLVVAVSRYVGLATVLAALAFAASAFAAAAFGAPQPVSLQVFSVAISALIVYTHRGNLQRLRRGEEPRLGRGPSP